MLFDHAFVLSSDENVRLDQWSDRWGEEEEGGGGKWTIVITLFFAKMDLAERAGRRFELNNPR